MTPAERLRAAATRLREVAGGATPGPWVAGVRCVWGLHSDDEIVVDGEDGDGGVLREADADYIAIMHPPVALALAFWLDDLAAEWPWDDDGTCVWDDGTPMRLEESLDTHALAVADAVLGGE